MSGVLVFLGVLLLLGGGATASAQYVPVDLSFLDSVAGARAFLGSPMALYAGGGAAGLGLLLIVVGAAAGGSKKRKPAPERAPAQKPARAAHPAPKAAAQPAPNTRPAAKPQASAKPPTNGSASADPETPSWQQDPRLTNRKRVSDLVSINDALKAYHAKNGAYPRADGLKGFPERGKAWIPGLSPDFIADLPRDPVQSVDREGPQYVYVSNGTDYKLLAHGVSLVGGTNVEVLGVRIDQSKSASPEKAAFGFWTAAYEAV